MVNIFNLLDLCNPKQWKTISQKDLSNNGYPFYSANGKVGFYKEYNHKNPTLLIGCRGTCGSLHITEPFSYTSGNAMALDNLNHNLVIEKYLFYFFKMRGFKDVITGSSQPQITREGLQKIKIPLPSLEEQKRIVKILDQASILIQKRKQAIELLDEYLKSVFLEMFGDPIKNNKSWDKTMIKNFGDIITGNTPPRNNPNNFTPKFIEWVKTDNIVQDKIYLTQATEYLSEEGLLKSRSVEIGGILVACIAGSIESIGRVALTNRKVAFNQQINAIQPNSQIDPLFLYWLIKMSKKYIQDHATKGMKRILTKGEFEKIQMIIPPLDLQNEFSLIAEKVEKVKQKMITQLEELENNFQSLMQKAFKGELIK